MKCSLMNREISRNGKGSSNFSWGCGEESLGELIGTLGGNDEENGMKKRMVGSFECPKNREHPDTYRCRKKGVVVIFRGCPKNLLFEKWPVLLPSTLQPVLMTVLSLSLYFQCCHSCRFIIKRLYLLYAIRNTRGKNQNIWSWKYYPWYLCVLYLLYI